MADWNTGTNNDGGDYADGGGYAEPACDHGDGEDYGGGGGFVYSTSHTAWITHILTNNTGETAELAASLVTSLASVLISPRWCATHANLRDTWRRNARTKPARTVALAVCITPSHTVWYSF